MKCFLLVVFAAACWGRTLEGDLSLFKDFKQTYGRTYTGDKEVHAFECFQHNLDKIDALNAMGGAVHGINLFADLCADEFKVYHSLRVPTNRTVVPVVDFTAAEVAATPSSVDWRKKGAVTAVKNQGQCGSCWSFSSTGNMEGQHFLAGNKLIGLSEEELVQCSSSFGNQGCNGGWMDKAFEWVVQNGGIDSESDYPYTSGGGNTGSCDNSKLKSVVAKYTGHKDIAHSESAMKAFCATSGPISIAVDAADGWQSYHGGIMTTCTGRQLDHGVLIVGYDTSYSTPYWIVKNSWAASWGEQGYIRLQYGTDQCGLTSVPSSSISAKK